MMALAPGGERRAEVVQPWEIEHEPPQITGNQRICIECGAYCRPNSGPDCLAGAVGACAATAVRPRCTIASADLADVVLTVTLTDDQLEAIARRVAQMLADRRALGPAPEFLTLARAAELARVAPKTIGNWLFAERLPRHGEPGRPRVARAELLAMIDPPPSADGRTPRPRRPGRPRASSGAFARLARGV